MCIRDSHQPFVLHQGIGLTELCGAAVGQPVVGAAGTALLGLPLIHI